MTPRPSRSIASSIPAGGCDTWFRIPAAAGCRVPKLGFHLQISHFLQSDRVYEHGSSACGPCVLEREAPRRGAEASPFYG
jgi:hypothetical protein